MQGIHPGDWNQFMLPRFFVSLKVSPEGIQGGLSELSMKIL
jgi:hypothetical protein